MNNHPRLISKLKISLGVTKNESPKEFMYIEARKGVTPTYNASSGVEGGVGTVETGR